VAGVAGGRRLRVPPRGTRPTTDRTREALFSVLGARRDFDGLRVLDLYSGSGALGLEALSRGAAAVLFVENDARAVAVLKANIATVGLSGAAVRRGSAAAVLAGGTDTPFDLVLADPPYDVPTTEVEALLTALEGGGWLSDDAIVVVERAAASPELGWPSDWTAWPSRRYGDTRIELAVATLT
jgi:16S rRNA (guanine(966)-N(2))-methyltransferase RsmD